MLGAFLMLSEAGIALASAAYKKVTGSCTGSRSGLNIPWSAPGEPLLPTSQCHYCKRTLPVEWKVAKFGSSRFGYSGKLPRHKPS